MSDPVYDAAFFEGQAARSLVSARAVLSRVFPLLRPRRLLHPNCVLHHNLLRPRSSVLLCPNRVRPRLAILPPRMKSSNWKQN